MDGKRVDDDATEIDDLGLDDVPTIRLSPTPQRRHAPATRRQATAAAMIARRIASDEPDVRERRKLQQLGLHDRQRRETQRRHMAALNDLASLNASVQAAAVHASVSAVRSQLPQQPAGRTTRGTAGKHRGALHRRHSLVRLPARPDSSAAGRRRRRPASGVESKVDAATGQARSRSGPSVGSSGGTTRDASTGVDEDDVGSGGGLGLGIPALQHLPDFGMTMVASFLSSSEWRALAQCCHTLRECLSPAFTLARLKTCIVEHGRTRVLRTRRVTALAQRLTGVTHLQVCGSMGMHACLCTAPHRNETCTQVVGGSLQPQSVPVFARTLPLWTALEVLELANAMVDDTSVGAIAEYLPKLPHLAALDLSRNMVGTPGAEALAAAMPSCPALEQVVLTDNYIGDRGVVGLARAVQECTQLWSLRLHGNRHTSAATPWLLEAVKTSGGRLCDLTM